MKVKVLHGFVKLLFYALPTGNLLHYLSGRNDFLHVSPITRNSSLNGNFLSVSFSREIPFPGAFPAKCNHGNS